MRELSGVWKPVASIMAVLFGVFAIFIIWRLPLHPMVHGPVFVGFGLLFTWLYYPAFNGRGPADRPSALDLFFMVLTAVIIIYSVANAMKYVRFPLSAGLVDIVVSTIWLVLLIEGLRRIYGLALAGLVIAVLLYALFGNKVPGFLGHSGFTWWRTTEFLAMSSIGGYWGIIAWTLTTIVPAFVVFGVLLFSEVGGETFVNIAKLVAGRVSGGAAQIAVVASAAMATINGSTTANVATTGTFTIPTMKRLGYRPEFAAAVEVSASTGGPLAPPIMGAGAFILAEMLGIPYMTVAKAAILPALIYFTGVSFSIYLEARKYKLKPLPKEEMPKWKEVFSARNIIPLLVPIVVLLYILMVKRTSPTPAAFWAIISILAISALMKLDDLKQYFKTNAEALNTAVKTLCPLFVLGGGIQIAVSLIGLTGFGVKISEIVLSLAGNNIWLALVLAGAITLLLGMGLPVTAAYLVGASVIVSTLVIMGLQVLNAHLFVFYFSILAAITPPVCAGVYTAMPIARTKLWPTAMETLSLSYPLYVVPFAFAFTPLLFMVGSVGEILYALITAIVGVMALSVAGRGYLLEIVPVTQRVLFLIGGIGLMMPGHSSNLVGIALLLIGLILNYFSWRRIRNARAVQFVNS